MALFRHDYYDKELDQKVSEAVKAISANQWRGSVLSQLEKVNIENKSIAEEMKWGLPKLGSGFDFTVLSTYYYGEGNLYVVCYRRTIRAILDTGIPSDQQDKVFKTLNCYMSLKTIERKEGANTFASGNRKEIETMFKEIADILNIRI